MFHWVLRSTLTSHTIERVFIKLEKTIPVLLPLKFKPLTNETWGDFGELFGEKGACGGCWCMWWKLKRSEFDKQKGLGNKKAIQSYVKSGKIPGILAYHQEEPVGWCAVEHRENYPVLDRSRILRKLDDTPVWSITCFFIKKQYRNKGMTVQILNIVKNYVKNKGGEVLEGYPIEPKKKHIPPVFAWTGFMSAFKDAGFIECARRSETRPIMRYHI